MAVGKILLGWDVFGFAALMLYIMWSQFPHNVR
jgi:hypothetical protein